LISLATAIVATLALFFGNFTLAYLAQLLRGEAIPAARFAGVLLVTAFAVGTLLWGGRWWWRRRPRSVAAGAAPTAYRSAEPVVTPTARPGSAPTPPPAGDGSSDDRWLFAEARRRLLILAETPPGFTLEQALAETALEPTDLSYLIDELVGARRLRAVASGRDFRYLLRDTGEAQSDESSTAH
jgi:hypothetical protein